MFGSSFVVDDVSSSSFTGKKSAANPESKTVRMIVRMLAERFANHEIWLAPKLHAKLMKINPQITLFVRAGGMMIAKNIPYNATLRALTTDAGRILPAIIPTAVPLAQENPARINAP